MMGLGKWNSFEIWPFLVSMLTFKGVTFSLIVVFLLLISNQFYPSQMAAPNGQTGDFFVRVFGGSTGNSAHAKILRFFFTRSYELHR